MEHFIQEGNAVCVAGNWVNLRDIKIIFEVTKPFYHRLGSSQAAIVCFINGQNVTISRLENIHTNREEEAFLEVENKNYDLLLSIHEMLVKAWLGRVNEST
jgi:hypothetical protein